MDLSKYKLIYEDDFSGGINEKMWDVCKKTVKADAVRKEDFEPAFAKSNSNGAFKPHNDLFYKKENVAVKDGKLTLTCDRCGDGFSSGALKLKNVSVKKGYVEVCAKTPHPGKGIMPLVQILTADDCTDDYSSMFDILFVPGESAKAYCNMRVSYVDRATGKFVHVKYLNPRTFAANADEDTPIDENYHTYALEWSDTDLIFSFDGKPYKKVDLENPCFGGFKQTYTLSVDLQVGSTEIPAPDETNVFPNELSIESVKIYELEE